MIDNAIYIVNGLVSGIAITVVGGVGFVWAKINNLKAQHDRLYDNLHARYTHLDEKYTELSSQKNKIEGLHLTDKDELEFYKREHKAIGDMYDELKKEFKQLADEHNELKDKHAPFASLNPFEQQAVSAMSDQSVYNEWLNGAPKEVK
jgi:peptidoglycan hydrolase CwlO-like protein